MGVFRVFARNDVAVKVLTWGSCAQRDFGGLGATDLAESALVLELDTGRPKSRFFSVLGT